MRDLRVLFAGNGGTANRGCQAIDISTAEILARHFRTVDVVRAPSSEDASEAYIPLANEVARLDPPGFARFPRYTPKWAVHRLAAHLAPEHAASMFAPAVANLAAAAAAQDVALAMGGDNYTLDYTTPDLYWAVNNTIIQSGVPLVFWGATIGPFERMPRYRRFALEQISRASMILARDRLTADYLRTCEVSVPVHLVADPAFTMQPATPQGAIDLPAAGSIGLNLSPIFGRYVGLNDEEWLRRAADIVVTVARRCGRPVWLIPHVQHPAPSDSVFMQTVLHLAKAQIGGDAPVRIASERLTAPEIKWLISRLDAFVGARMHSVIAGLSSRTPTGTLAYSTKSYGVNEEVLGHHRWVLPAQASTADAVATLFDSLLVEQREYRDELAQNLPAVLARAESAGVLLADWLSHR